MVMARRSNCTNVGPLKMALKVEDRQKSRRVCSQLRGAISLLCTRTWLKLPAENTRGRGELAGTFVETSQMVIITASLQIEEGLTSQWMVEIE